MPVPTTKLVRLNKEVKLGRRVPTAEMRKRALPLKKYVDTKKVGDPPTSTNYREKATRSLSTMLANDQHGDCVIAAAAHGVGLWSANEPGGAEAVATDAEVVRQYQSICGPGDNGCYIGAVLDHFRDRGLKVAGVNRTIEGYVSVDPRDPALVKIATHLFGGLHLGINWPADWSNQARPGAVLKPTNSQMVGGHAVQVVDYDSTGLHISTWGFVCVLGWEALADSRFVDEVYAMIGTDWFNEHGQTASGVNVTQLRADLATIAAGGTPDIDDDPPQPQPPGPGPIALKGRIDGTLGTLFGALPVNLQIELSPMISARASMVDYWALLKLGTQLVRQLISRDWEGAFATILQIVALLGMTMTDAQAARVRAALCGGEGPTRECGPADEDASPDPNSLDTDAPAG